MLQRRWICSGRSRVCGECEEACCCSDESVGWVWVIHLFGEGEGLV